MEKIRVSIRHNRVDYFALADVANVFAPGQHFDLEGEVCLLVGSGGATRCLTLRSTHVERVGCSRVHFCRVRETNLDLHQIFSGDDRWAVLEVLPAQVAA